MKKMKKEKRNAKSITFFTTLSKQILSGRLLLVFIGGQFFFNFLIFNF